MKAGDEIIVGGKTYVAADMQLLQTVMGFDKRKVGLVCAYCTDACKIERGDCIRNQYRKETSKVLILCTEEKPRVYFFLKPEVDHESG